MQDDIQPCSFIFLIDPKGYRCVNNPQQYPTRQCRIDKSRADPGQLDGQLPSDTVDAIGKAITTE